MCSHGEYNFIYVHTRVCACAHTHTCTVRALLPGTGGEVCWPAMGGQRVWALCCRGHGACPRTSLPALHTSFSSECPLPPCDPSLRYTLKFRLPVTSDQAVSSETGLRRDPLPSPQPRLLNGVEGSARPIPGALSFDLTLSPVVTGERSEASCSGMARPRSNGQSVTAGVWLLATVLGSVVSHSMGRPEQHPRLPPRDACDTLPGVTTRTVSRRH